MPTAVHVAVGLPTTTRVEATQKFQPREFLQEQPISHNLFYCDKAVTEQHIRTVLGERILTHNDGDIELLTKEVAKIKREATS